MDTSVNIQDIPVQVLAYNLDTFILTDSDYPRVNAMHRTNMLYDALESILVDQEQEFDNLVELGIEVKREMQRAYKEAKELADYQSDVIALRIPVDYFLTQD